MVSVSPAEPALPAVGRDINCILSSGSVTEPQAETLQAAFKELDFCSVGVHVREYGTVITTDTIVNAGFVDLSLHPLRLSLVGCVIARGTAYHDNVSTHSIGVPVDITRAVERHGIKCAVCIPIMLAAVMSEGSTLASEHVLGTLMLGSCKLNGVTREHRRLAEAVAASMAPKFADSTSSMYNNITDYVLGPMHGHPYPTLSERPLAQPRSVIQDGCWLDDSDHPDDASSESQHSMASASNQLSPISSRDPLCQAGSSTSFVPPDRPSPQKGGASPHKHTLTKKPNFESASKLRKRNLSTAQRHVAKSSEEAQQRTKVQLLYMLVIIATATCVGYLTPSRQRGPLLIWPPFLQLLPLIFLSFDPNRYYRNSEVMHVLLNITKTIWAVCFGVPRLAPFWTPGRRLAIAWKFGLDFLMVSGLGELARFSTFVWVQALDLVIVATRSSIAALKAGDVSVTLEMDKPTGDA
ncbi:hypothetical protein WJX82_000079 [Trebouxia sp. C0006]